MPSSASAKRLLVFGIIVLLALFIAGLITGAIGAAFTTSDESLFTTGPESVSGLDQGDIPDSLHEEFEGHGVSLSHFPYVTVVQENREWTITDGEDVYSITREGDGLAVSHQQEASGIIPKPEVHLPAQVVFIGRDQYLDFLDAEEAEKALEAQGLHGHDLEEAMEHETGERTGKDLHQLVGEGSFGGGFNWVITNSLLSAWIASLLLIAIFFFGTRKANLIPGRFQNFCEIIVEALLNFVESVVGRERARMVFPIIATIFLFVVFNAWIGLLPIYPSLGWLSGDHVVIHLLRPAGTDLNMPLALAIVSFVFVEFLGLRLLGFRYVTKFVRVGSLVQGISSLFRFRLMEAFQGLLDFFFVGPLEAFSELVRLISFTFRLFGNMTAGEILVLISAFLVPFIATLGVYGLELLVGFVQALIFAGLTLVFASIAMTPHGEEEH